MKGAFAVPVVLQRCKLLAQTVDDDAAGLQVCVRQADQKLLAAIAENSVVGTQVRPMM